MIHVELHVLGTKQLDFALSQTIKEISDFRPLWPEFVQALHSIEAEQFEAEGRGRTGKWPELSKWTTETKFQRFPGTKILERTRRLRGSLDSMGEGAIRDISHADHMVFGTSVPYAIFHQKGTGGNTKGRRLPMRRVIDLKVEDQVKFAKAMHRYINKNAFRGFKK